MYSGHERASGKWSGLLGSREVAVDDSTLGVVRDAGAVSGSAQAVPARSVVTTMAHFMQHLRGLRFHEYHATQSFGCLFVTW
jgi:hypothetical protein